MRTAQRSRPARSPGSRSLQQAVEQAVGRHAQPIDQSDQGGEANLALATLDAGHLNGRKPCLVSEVFLRPTAIESRLPDVGAESLQGAIHVAHRPRAEPIRP